MTALAATAATVQSLSVHHHGHRYAVDLHMRLDAPMSAVYSVLTDYSQLQRVNPAIKYTHILPTSAGTPTEVKTRVHLCVAFYCRDLVQVQKMYATPPNRLRAVIVPFLSDFKAGSAYWHLSRDSGNTQLHFHASMTPDFWVPPVIGPWLIQRVLRAQAVRTGQGIEKAAKAAH